MRKNDAPKISVIVPVYNHERYIRQAIDSVLAQTFTNFEIIVIDDGSTDSSRCIIASYDDPRIRRVYHQRNLGIPHTQNEGLSLARGEYIAWLDDDDYAHPHRLAKQAAFLDDNPNVALVGSWRKGVDDEGKILKTIKLPCAPDEIRAALLFRCAVPQSSITARSAILKSYGYRDEFLVGHDYDLLVRLVGAHKLANLPEVLLWKRRHSGQATAMRADLAKKEKMQICATQLAALGVAFTEKDLENHFVLHQMRSLGFQPDVVYLDWAEDWLIRLHEANHRSKRYPEPALTRVLGWAWLKVCSRASTGAGWSAWHRFLRSPLWHHSWSHLERRMALRVLRWLPKEAEDLS